MPKDKIRRRRLIAGIIIALFALRTAALHMHWPIRSALSGFDLSPYRGARVIEDFLPEGYYENTRFEVYPSTTSSNNYELSAEDNAVLAGILSGVEGRYLLWNGTMHSGGLDYGKRGKTPLIVAYSPGGMKKVGDTMTDGIVNIWVGNRHAVITLNVYKYADTLMRQAGYLWTQRTVVAYAVDDPEVRKQLLQLMEHVAAVREPIQ